MKDPVALAYSGRIPEARAAALAQAASDDSYLVDQGLEALAVLGQQHGIRSNAQIDRLLLDVAATAPVSLRRIFEAAMSVQCRAVEPVAVERMRTGKATWELLRYAGELPSYALSRALAEGWSALPANLLDEALLTSCVMPVANPEEAAGWGRRALAEVRHPAAETRVAAFMGLTSWRPDAAARACAEALTDEHEQVRRLAADLLVEIDPQLLGERVAELGAEASVAQAAWERVRPRPARATKG